MPPKNTKADFAEAGISGLKRSAGYVQEEFLTELSGARWRRVLRQMITNDPVIVAFGRVVEMLTRQVAWDIAAATEDDEGMRAKEFYKDALFKDMSSTWQDTLSEIVTFIQWGFQYSEIVFKRRSGENRDPSKNSRFNDGLIGIRKLAGRAQETIDRWEFDENGGVQAALQVAAPDYRTREIPIEKALLFRTSANKGNPEGVSTCRGAYTSWYYKSNIQRVEAIGIERDLAGYPVVKIPASVIQAGGEVYESYKAMAVNTRRDEQEGAVIPSDCWDSGKGNPMYELKLLSTAGARAFDTDKIVNRYDQRMLMSQLADFLILGHEKVGSFALSSDKTSLFSVAHGAYLDSICEVVNRHLIPRVHRLNGFRPETMPTLTHGAVNAPSIKEVAEAVSTLSGAGISFTDEEVAWVKKQVPGMPVAEEKDAGRPQTAGKDEGEPAEGERRLRVAAE
jgi:hypothetical protein